MQRIFSRDRMNSKRPGIVQELEQLARHARLLPIILPVLLLVGLGTGRLLSGALRLPDGTPAYASILGPAEPIRLEAISAMMHRVRATGDNTAEYIELYRHEVAPIERVLRRRGISSAIARRVAWPLVEQSYRNGVDPATVVTVMLIESAGKPDATSSVGARGLMQVMPFWSGHWRGCGRNLYDIEANLCNGTKILALYLDRHKGDERRAFLGYNGCVRGTNTANCFQYPDKIASLRRQVVREIEAARSRSTLNRTAALTATD